MIAKKSKTRPRTQPPKRNGQGASRRLPARPVKSTGLIRRLLKVITVVTSLAAVAVSVERFQLLEKWQGFYERPIEHIQIEGEFLYLGYDQINETVKQSLSRHFMALDLTEIKRTLEADPWVDRAQVTKKWPDRLLVKVVEQQPIARWGNAGFLNMRGDIIRVPNNEALASLPLLSGEDQYATEVMQHYLRMGKVLAQAEMSLESVELDETRAWTLKVDNNKTLKLGRDQVWEKLQHLIFAKKTVLAKKFDQVVTIDLRYHNGMAVGWQAPMPQPAIAQN